MPVSSRPAAFIDRDGVINAELGYVGHPTDFRLLPNTVAGLRKLSECGFALVVVTNQAGIAKGRYSEQDYHRLTGYMREVLTAQKIELAGVYYCPHHPAGSVAQYAVACDCRKPAPGMLRRAAVELDLELPRSLMIGDKISDTLAGRAAGVRWSILVRSGHPLPDTAAEHADYCCDDLLAAAQWVCGRNQSPNS
jgi:D-glycero-D-manno-heptose 1,7-bisphosphate phosphatase